MAYPPCPMRYVCVGAAISRPVVSPWETTSARCADNAIPNICKRNSAVQCRNMVFLQYCYIIRPIWFCSKICNVGGRMISAPTTHRNIRSVIRWHRLRRGGYHPPGCFPSGETTSAQSADNAIPNICKRNSAVQCRNMVHCGTLCRAIPIGNRRADTIRPYADGAAELPPQKFRCPI